MLTDETHFFDGLTLKNGEVLNVNSLPVAGTYYAELPEGVELETFLSSFAFKLSDYFSEYLTDDYEADEFIFRETGYGDVDDRYLLYIFSIEKD